MTVTKAIEFVGEEIAKNADQAFIPRRCEASRFEYVRRSDVRLKLAKEPLGRCHAADLTRTFKELHAALDAAYLQDEEEEEARVAGKVIAGGGFEVTGTFFEGQGLYGRARAPNSKLSPPNGFCRDSNNSGP